MTLPQLKLVLAESTHCDADRALIDLRVAGAAGLATSNAKHNPDAYKALERALLNHT